MLIGTLGFLGSQTGTVGLLEREAGIEKSLKSIVKV
jgi:hypothetical protein